MADIEHYLEALLEREGGYVDHPDDRGGPTNWGITEKVARAHGFEGAMRDLNRAQAEQIYREIYWHAPGFDRVAMLSPIVAEELFDTGVNMGPEMATGFLQRALNALNRKAKDYPDLLVDRQLGPATLGALRAFLKWRGQDGEAVLCKALNVLQGARYLDLAEARQDNESFVYGWLAHRVG